MENRTDSLKLIFLPMLFDNLDDNPMVFILPQSTHDNDCNNSLDTLDTQGDGSAVNRVFARLVIADSKLGCETCLVAIKLAVHKPRTLAKP